MHLNTAECVAPGRFLSSCGAESFDESHDRESNISPGVQINPLMAENCELRGQLEQLRAERARWTETQRRLMELLHTSSPEKLVHDLRNLLNERDLLKALVDQM